MKRLFPVIIALTLLLSACGAAQPAPTPAPTPSPVSTPAATPETGAASSELSPLCSWALQELDEWRQSEYGTDNDVKHIKETVRLFLYMHYDMFVERECRFPDFSPFLDPNGEGYEKLLYFVAETQYIHLDDGFDEDVQWYNVDLDFESVEVDGNSASVTADGLLPALDLLDAPRERAAMVRRQAELINPCAAGDICDLAERMAGLSGAINARRAVVAC